MSKRIVVLSDGTGQSVGRNDSNVLRLCRLLDLSEHSGQMAIYDPGIGTHVDPERIATDLQLSASSQVADSTPGAPMLRWLRQPFELGYGAGTTANIKQLYLALGRAYEPGDDIYLFGFSRGAFTVRALAGLVYRCGLLTDKATPPVDEAVGWCQQHYTGMTPERRAEFRAQVDAFRRRHARPCNIRFLGVWDTVKSVGYIRPMNLPHTRHNPIVEHVRHALSIDERRSFYLYTTWGGLWGESRHAVYAPASFDLDATDDPTGQDQDVKEIWFPGNHADVGGGYPPGESAAANNSLQWMVCEARRVGLNSGGGGLKFDADRYKKIFPQEKYEAVTRRHDEMRDGLRNHILWWVADHSPRWELHNEPPPPRTQFTYKPAGARKLASSLRCTGGVRAVRIHESARGVYEEGSAPWRGIPTEELLFEQTDDDARPRREE